MQHPMPTAFWAQEEQKRLCPQGTRAAVTSLSIHTQQRLRRYNWGEVFGDMTNSVELVEEDGDGESSLGKSL